jgi:hypothetical protein
MDELPDLLDMPMKLLYNLLIENIIDPQVLKRKQSFYKKVAIVRPYRTTNW